MTLTIAIALVLTAFVAGTWFGYRTGTSSETIKARQRSALTVLAMDFENMDLRNPGAAILASRAAAITRAMVKAVEDNP